MDIRTIAGRLAIVRSNTGLNGLTFITSTRKSHYLQKPTGNPSLTGTSHNYSTMNTNNTDLPGIQVRAEKPVMYRVEHQSSY
jgi:hypothetical protein